MSNPHSNLEELGPLRPRRRTKSTKCRFERLNGMEERVVEVRIQCHITWFVSMNIYDNIYIYNIYNLWFTSIIYDLQHLWCASPFRILIHKWILYLHQFAYLWLAGVFNIDFHAHVIINETLHNGAHPCRDPGRLCSEPNSFSWSFKNCFLRLPGQRQPQKFAGMSQSHFLQEEAEKTRRGPDWIVGQRCLCVWTVQH